MKFLLIIISFFLIITQGFAQENPNVEEVTIEEAQTGAKGLMKELFMFKMAKDVLETRQLISDNELGDSVENFMTNYDNALFFKSTLDYYFFWNSVLGRKKYKVPSSQLFLDSKEKYLSDNAVNTSIDFDIVLKPNWEDLAKEDKLKDYSVKITPGNYTNLSFSDDEKENFNTVLNSHFATNVASPKDAKVNEAVFNGLAAIRVLCEDLKIENPDGIDVELADIKFSGDNQKDIDNKFSKYAGCYFGNVDKGSKIKIEFKPVFKKGNNHTANNFYIKILVKRNDKILVEETTSLAKYDEKEKIYITNEAFNLEVPDQVSYYEDINVTLWVSSSEDAGWKEMGIFKPILYVTYREPIYKIDERFLYFSSNNSNGEGVTLNEKMLNGIWKQFELNNGQFKGNLYLKDFDPNLSNTQIGYYLSNYMNNTQAKSLFEPNAHSGECAAFQDLFISLMEHQGINSKRVTLSPFNSSDQFFLVKNWNFKGVGSSGNLDYPYVNYPSNVVSDYVENRLTSGHYGWIGTPEVIEEDGIAGQGNENPFADFNAHYIVKIGNVYYDPSYGKIYNSIKEWEDNSIDGFYKEEEYEKSDGTMSLKWIIRENTTSTEIKEE